ncbi:SMR family transporter [Snodgrassella sp. CFCC 13594]|uniref:SMR family transporter n=1 Tax=Snodgrassella sp. CFCC 13594 TaxID=1775559 RepID=UPI00082B0DA7|nr:SMR family transporter [Snodgrassella sp. CFCC 13594]
MNYLIFLLAIASISLNAFAQIALRKTMLTMGGMPDSIFSYFQFGIHLLVNMWFLLGMACYAVSIGLWMGVLGKVEVSLAYPLLSIGYVITAVIGYFFMHEDVNMIRIIGLATICVGIFIISRSA